jgi:amino acid transporter
VNGTADHLYLFMGFISTILIVLNYLFTGDANTIFWTLFSFASLVFMLNYLFLFPAALVLRIKDKTPRKYQVPGGLPGLILCVCLCTAGTLLSVIFFIDWDIHGYAFWMEIIGTAATLLSGWLLYRKGKAREKKSAAV